MEEGSSQVPGVVGCQAGLDYGSDSNPIYSMQTIWSCSYPPSLFLR